MIRNYGGLTYVNCGDWVESCTAVVEHFDGRLELNDWTKRSAGGAGDDAIHQFDYSSPPAIPAAEPQPPDTAMRSDSSARLSQTRHRNPASLS
jgi:hypothetical protein